MPQRIAALSSEVSSSGKISTLSGCLFSSSSVTLASSILAPVILSAFAGKSVPAVLLSEIKQMKAKNGNECASLSTERLVFLYCVSQICLRSMTIYTKQSKTEWMPFVKYLVSLFDAAQGLTYMIRVILFGISCIVLRMSDKTSPYIISSNACRGNFRDTTKLKRPEILDEHGILPRALPLLVLMLSGSELGRSVLVVKPRGL